MAGKDTRELYVAIVGDDRSLQRAYKQSAEATQKFDRQMSQTTRGAAAASGAFRSMGRSIAFASTGFLSGAGLVAGLKSSVNAASNLAEQQNKVNVVFGKSGEMINDWAKTTAGSIGIANDQALEAAGTFGNLFRTVGLASGKNAELSRSLVTLAADMASFNNADPSEVLLALRSGLIGEAEPLRRFGVLLSETRVQQEAMRETGKDNAKALTDQEKVLARYNLILKDTAPAQGDFANTSEGLANSQRTLSAEVRDLSAALGSKLKPAVEEVTRTLADGIAPQDKSADRVKKISLQSRVLHGTLTGLGAILKSTGKQLEEDIGPALKLAEALNRLGQSAGQIKPITVFDPAERQPGRAPGGPGAFQPPAGAGGAAGGGRLSFQGQMNLLETRLAKALTTVSKADDRAILVLEKHLLQRWIAHTKDWKLRRQLYEDLARVDGQITAIDEDKAQQAQDAADKEKEAKQKERDAEKKRLEAHRAHIRAMRAAWQEQLAKIREATDQVRSEIGELPFQAQGPEKGILGVPGMGAGGFAKAYADQTRTFVNFYNDLRKLGRRGAPRGLVEQFRASGLEAASTVHGLLTGPRGALRSVIRSFREREQIVQQIAKADIHARYVTIHVAGNRIGTTAATQRRGRQAGVPSSIGSYIGG